MDPETNLERRGHCLPARDVLGTCPVPCATCPVPCALAQGYLQAVDGLRTSRQTVKRSGYLLLAPDFDFSEAEVGIAPFRGFVEEKLDSAGRGIGGEWENPFAHKVLTSNLGARVEA